MTYKKQIILSLLVLMIIWKGASAKDISLESLVRNKDIPDGWALIDGPNLYTKKTLFEHIDGQAELFFKYGFQKSAFAIYQDKENRGNQIELDIYDMGSVLHAFGIFSRFRAEEQLMDIGLDSYLDDQSALFYKGRYFVMLYATEPNPSILRVLAKGISSKILDHSPPPKEIGYFPKGGLKPGSIQYFPEGLLGHQFLGRGFQGAYIEKVKVKERDLHLFLAIFKDSQNAISALKFYKDYLAEKGKIHLRGLTQLKGEDPYGGRVVIVSKGFYLAGAVGFMNEVEAESLLAELVKNITFKSNPSHSF